MALTMESEKDLSSHERMFEDKISAQIHDSMSASKWRLKPQDRRLGSMVGAQAPQERNLMSSPTFTHAPCGAMGRCMVELICLTSLEMESPNGFLLLLLMGDSIDLEMSSDLRCIVHKTHRRHSSEAGSRKINAQASGAVCV